MMDQIAGKYSVQSGSDDPTTDKINAVRYLLTYFQANDYIEKLYRGDIMSSKASCREQRGNI